MEKWLQIGELVPLFDRLIDNNTAIVDENPPLINYSEEQLKASIIDETNKLFNTRCTLTYEDYMDLTPFTASYAYPTLYGLPNFIFTDPDSLPGRTLAQNVTEAALRVFEPRLQSIQVTIDSYTPETQTLSLTIRAQMILRRLLRPIQFPVVIRGYGASKSS